MRVLSLLTVLALLVFGAAPVLAQQTASEDDRIHDEVIRRLAGDREVKGGGIEVDVASGVVTLRGRVREEKLKARAERLTLKVKGVKQVVNELRAELAPEGTESAPKP